MRNSHDAGVEKSNSVLTSSQWLLASGKIRIKTAANDQFFLDHGSNQRISSCHMMRFQVVTSFLHSNPLNLHGKIWSQDNFVKFNGLVVAMAIQHGPSDGLPQGSGSGGEHLARWNLSTHCSQPQPPGPRTLELPSETVCHF